MSYRSGAHAVAIVAISVCAHAYMCSAQTQSQASASTGGSTWRAGSAGVAAPTPHVSVAGSSSSWTAGKGSIPVGHQSGGVWHEGTSMGSTLPQSFAGKLGAIGRLTVGPSSLVSLAPSPSSGGKMSSRGATTKMPTGLHPSTGLRPSSGGTSSSGVHAVGHRVGGTKIGARRRASLTATKRGSTSSGLNGEISSPLQRDSALKPLSSSTGDHGGGELQPPLAGGSH